MNQERHYNRIEINYDILNKVPQHTKLFIESQIQKANDLFGLIPLIYYSTFIGDGFSGGMATLIISDESIGKFIVTAHETELDSAILWVKINNPHLDFPEWQMTAYNADDFVHNRKSAVMIINTSPSVSPLSER